MKMLHLFCHGFAVFVTAVSIFAQSHEPTPPSGKDFKSILIVPAKEPSHGQSISLPMAG